MRERGASLVQEPLANRLRTRDMLRSFWVQQHQRRKGDWEELKRLFCDLPPSDKVKNVELFLMTDSAGDNEQS